MVCCGTRRGCLALVNVLWSLLLSLRSVWTEVEPSNMISTYNPNVRSRRFREVAVELVEINE